MTFQHMPPFCLAVCLAGRPSPHSENWGKYLGDPPASSTAAVTVAMVLNRM